MWLFVKQWVCHGNYKTNDDDDNADDDGDDDDDDDEHNDGHDNTFKFSQ